MRIIQYGQEHLQKNTYKRMDFSHYLLGVERYEIFAKTNNEVEYCKTYSDHVEIQTGEKEVTLKWIIVEPDFSDPIDITYYMENYPIF